MMGIRKAYVILAKREIEDESETVIAGVFTDENDAKTFCDVAFSNDCEELKELNGSISCRVVKTFLIDDYY